MNDESDPIQLSRCLLYLAAERTLTSWIRTALSLMALGFVIDRFQLVLALMPVVLRHVQDNAGTSWRWSGSILIGMGAAVALGAGVQYLHFALAFHREGPTRVGHGIVIGAAFSILLGFFSVALIFLLTAMGR
ncbi:MAG: DUF202 domain-containing protein [Pseudomonadota bacterium]|nr:DUF202 domain-containing protein [Pseudomonadota bacterium]